MGKINGFTYIFMHRFALYIAYKKTFDIPFSVCTPCILKQASVTLYYIVSYHIIHCNILYIFDIIYILCVQST